MIKAILRCLTCVFICLLTFVSADARQKDTIKKDTDTSGKKPGFVEKMQAFAKKSARESANDLAADRAVITQSKTFEELKKTIQKARIYLNANGDSTSIKIRLGLIEKDFETAGDGVLTNKGTAQTFRNLTATSKILNELLSKTTATKSALDRQQQQWYTFRYQLDSLSGVPALFQFPNDSTGLSKYLQQLVVVAREITPVDSALKQATINTQMLLNRTNLILFKLQSGQEEISHYQQDLAANTLKREFGNIWEPASYYRPFGEILDQAKAKGVLTLLFYVENNSGKLLILALLIISSFFYLRSLKNIYKENELLVSDNEGQLVLKYPLLSASLLGLNILQFIFFSPPFILNVIFWAISCICLTFIFNKFITRYWMRVWLVMVGLFAVSALDNLVLQASRTERWFMLAIALAGAAYGVQIVLKGRKSELKEKLILISIGFMAVLESSSALANVFGRYNLSKTLLIGGYLNVVVAILFLWTVRLINEGLLLAFSVYRQQDRKLFYLNFDKVGSKVPTYFYILLILGWVILFGRNFAGFDDFAGPLRNFFTQERTLGSYTYSINGLVLFLGIMAISVITSKIVSFFATDRHLAHDKEEHKAIQGIGSWLLLVRIAILSIGLFLAIAAAGIPVDRITIVLGALGVGIGFGLQTMVNNLVSGLIIAFEKPVNVGDIVDVDGQAGTMKSVGFRSSVITTWDGADVVMPNGDLLNSHLINWSLGGNKRRMTIVIGIAYDADLETVQQLLMDVLAADERIMKKPAPAVQYHQFGSSAIEVKVYFWTRDFKEALAIKSDVIVHITNTFKTNNVTIPFPQQDVHIQNKIGDLKK